MMQGTQGTIIRSVAVLLLALITVSSLQMLSGDDVRIQRNDRLYFPSGTM